MSTPTLYLFSVGGLICVGFLIRLWRAVYLALRPYGIRRKFGFAWRAANAVLRTEEGSIRGNTDAHFLASYLLHIPQDVLQEMAREYEERYGSFPAPPVPAEPQEETTDDALLPQGFQVFKQTPRPPAPTAWTRLMRGDDD